MQKLIERCKSLILKPAEEFAKIKSEEISVVAMFKDYALLLAAIPAVAAFIGFALIGISVIGITVRVPIQNALIFAILQYGLTLGGLYLLGIIIDTLASNFGSTKDLNASLKVAVFSYIPAFIAGIFMIIPSLSFLAMIGGLYSLYLLYIGIKVIKEPPQDKAVSYAAVSIIILVVIYAIINVITNRIVFGGFYTPGGF